CPAAAATASSSDHCTVGRPAEGLTHSAQMTITSSNACLRWRSVQHAAGAVVQHERWNVDFEALAVLGHAEITAPHGSAGGAQAAPARVLEGFAGPQQRLLADDTESLDF